MAIFMRMYAGEVLLSCTVTIFIFGKIFSFEEFEHLILSFMSLQLAQRVDGVRVVRIERTNQLNEAPPVTCYLRENCVSLFSPTTAPSSGTSQVEECPYHRVLLRFMTILTANARSVFP